MEVSKIVMRPSVVGRKPGEADAKAGRLDPLWRQAVKGIEGGGAKPLNEVINGSQLLAGLPI